VNLHEHPIEEVVTLPDGRDVRVRVGVAPDPYIPDKLMDTVDVEVFEGETPLAIVNTPLSANDDAAARELARRLAAGLASGEIAPAASAIEPLADSAGDWV
jgi:hypothetical protein